MVSGVCVTFSIVTLTFLNVPDYKQETFAQQRQIRDKCSVKLATEVAYLCSKSNDYGFRILDLRQCDLTHRLLIHQLLPQKSNSHVNIPCYHNACELPLHLYVYR